MKKRFTFLIAALMLLVFMMPSLAGWGQTRSTTTFSYSAYSGQGTSGSGGNCTATQSGITITSSKAYCSSDHVKEYGGNNKSTITITSNSTITSVEITFKNGYTGTFVVPDGAPGSYSVSNNKGTWSGSSTSVTLTNNANGQARWTQIVVTYTSSNPEITVDGTLTVSPAAVTNGELSVAYANITPTSGTITLFDAQDNDITLSCTWFTPSFNADFSKVTYNAIDNTTGAENSLRMHLAVTDGTKNATADVTVSQDFILTTMEQILTRATANGSTAKSVTVRFNDWVISAHNGSGGNASNATKAWLTDNNTKGCTIGGSSLGFNVKDVLSGTVTCSLKLLTGFAQLVSLTSASSGLSIAETPGTVTVSTTTIDALNAVNTGSLVTLEGLTYNGSTLSDGTNSITPTSTLYSSMSFSSNTTYNVTGIFEYYKSGNTVTKKIYPRSAADIIEVTSPVITVDASLSSFTYCEGEGPSAAQTITVSGFNLKENITLELNNGNGSAFEISHDNSQYTNNLTLTHTNGTVDVTTIYVRMKAGLEIIAAGYDDAINLTSRDATTKTVDLEGTVTTPKVTWDLSAATYVTDPSPTDNLIQWTSSYVTMKNERNGGTKVTNYLGGSNPHTRMYNNNLLTFTPASGYIIASIVMTGTNSSNFSNGLNNSNFNNGTVAISENIATITPINGNIPVSVTVSATIQVSSVTVYYSVSTATIYNISIDNEMTNGSVVADKSEATAGATITLTIYPAAGYYLEDDNIMVDVSGVEPTKINAGQFTFEMPENDVTVYADFSVYSGIYYTLVNSTADLIPGRHYIIASSKTAGGAYAMAAQNSGYRERVAVEVVGNFIYGQPNGLHEVVLSGDNTNLWTLYDDGVANSSKGYLYASSTSANNIGTRADNVTTNPERGQWAINITEGVASIVSQIGDDKPNTIRYNDGNSRFSCYNNSQAPVYLYMKADETDYEFYSNTTLSESNIITVSANSILTVNAGTLTNDNPAYLIIKDGGQLKFYDNGAKDGEVQATLEKNIEKYTANNNGWNFIASPINVDNLAPTDVTNMLSNAYDLYQLNNTKWENYKDNEGHTNANPGFSLVNGHGYLYANSNDVTLSFAGTVKPYSTVDPTANQVTVSAGWNLIGNPYTFDVYVNQPYYSISQAQTGITANTEASYAAIKPCTGILVYAKSNGYVVEFLENEPDASTGNHGNIQMTLAHNVATRDGNRSETIDNAIVSFNEDAHLEKFYFGEPEANIYIPQNGRDYAIAFSNRQGDVPLNFKTNKISTYTISFEGEEMNLNGVYLIDMLEEEEIYLGTTPSYTFLGSPSDKAARFKIVFRNTGDDADSDIFAYQNGTDIIVSGEGELQIFDVMGRKVSSQRINGVETMCTSSLQKGVYVFRLNEKTQKIVVR